MKNKYFISSILSLAFVVMMLTSSAQAFWLWTPEQGTWVNPKNSVKATPAEQLEYANTFFLSKQYAEARREYRKLIKQFPRAREAAGAQFGLAQIWEASGKYARAVDDYQMVVDKYPFSELVSDVVDRQYAIGVMLMEGKAQDSQLKSSLLGTEHKVVDIFQKVIKNDSYGKYAASAKYKIGLFYQARKEYQEARDAFEKVLNDHPGTDWAQSAKYQIAMSDAKRSVDSQYDQNTTKAAVEGFQGFLEEHPDSVLSQEAQKQVSALRDKEAENAFLVAEFYEKNGKSKAARIYYNELIANYSDTQWADKAKAQVNKLIVEDK